MRDYKGWTGKERLASLKKTKAAIAAGIIPPPTKCNRCGKTTGRIDYHNHDYSDPIKNLEPLCQGCHIRLHREENKKIDSETGTTKILVPANKTKIVRVYDKANSIILGVSGCKSLVRETWKIDRRCTRNYPRPNI
jgi:transposase-like protein